MPRTYFELNDDHTALVITTVADDDTTDCFSPPLGDLAQLAIVARAITKGVPSMPGPIMGLLPEPEPEPVSPLRRRRLQKPKRVIVSPVLGHFEQIVMKIIARISPEASRLPLDVLIDACLTSPEMEEWAEDRRWPNIRNALLLLRSRKPPLITVSDDRIATIEHRSLASAERAAAADGLV